MKTRSLLFVSALAAAAASQAAGLAGNSIAVYQVGDGSAALTSAATPTFVLDYSTTANAPALGTYAVPTIASGSNKALTESGTATSDGQLTLSGDGKTILFTGYNAPVGTASVASTPTTSTTATNYSRLVGVLNVGSGAIDTSTVTGTAFNTNNVRAAYSFGSSPTAAQGYAAIGGNTGVVTGTLGTSNGAALASNTITNFRYVTGFGGGLYASTASGSARGVYQIDPSTGAQTAVLNLGATGSPYAFQFLSATSLLVADDTSTTGGLTLYTNSGSGFVATSSLTGNPTRSFAHGNGSIYFTSADGLSLNSVTLTGTTFGTVANLQTAATNTVFRGVAFVPQAVPEPSAFAALGLGALGLLRRRRKA